MAKTDKMLLIEARDPQGRDIKDILRDAYEETGTVEKAAEKVSDTYGIDLAPGLFHDWVKDTFGGTIRKTIVFPEAEAEAVPA